MGHIYCIQHIYERAADKQTQITNGTLEQLQMTNYN